MPTDHPRDASRQGAAMRILHLEDNPLDRELVRMSLRAEGLVCEFTYAASEPEFAGAFAGRTFDLILADFTLPGYDGTDALAWAQREHPEVPFIFVSGTIGEDRAIEMVQGGATDYVLKSRLERLPPAVYRARREAGERIQREAAAAALRQSEERFRAMAERIDHVFWIATHDVQRWLYVSPAYEAIWGLPVAALYAQPEQWCDAVVADDRALFDDARAQLAAGRESRVEYRIRRPDGSLRWIEDRSYPALATGDDPPRAVGVAMDVTRAKQLESQLLHAQKMEAVGQLAGGVAHDFNNVLTVVTGYARLLLDGGGLPPDAVEPLQQIFTAGMRASTLTRQLLVFSRKQAVHRQVLDLNRVVDDIAKMIARLIGEHIAFKLELAPAPATTDADSGMMEQVLMNLAINARDAMPAGGTLWVATASVQIGVADPRAHPEARAGDFVCLTVSDTGCGIPPENRPRIFEPFYTTKGSAHGTGLGLATVLGIVQQHQGWIEVDSVVNVGTCFRIFLPAAPAAAADVSRRPGQAAVARGGTETVLLVEDEQAVREFAVALLKGHGYRVLQAGSGVEALEVWKWHRDRIALLFSDLVMPEGLGGIELAEILRKEKPTLRVIFTSGYAAESIEHDFRPPPGTHFLHKPYKPQALAQTVRDALDAHFDR